MAKQDKNPRTCVVTRQELPVSQMIRFVAGPSDEIVPDIHRKLPGRGVWVSTGKAHLQKAIEKDLFSRALRTKVTVPQELEQRVAERLRADCLGLFSLAKKAGSLISGFSKVEGLIRSDQVEVIVHAKQAASDGVGKLTQALRVMENDEVAIISIFDGEELDAALGLDNVTYVALTEGKLSEKFVSAVSRLEAYETN